MNEKWIRETYAKIVLIQGGESEHSKYSPSSLSRLLNCLASYQQSKGIEDEPSVYAMEGSILHAAAEMSMSENSPYTYDTFEGMTEEQWGAVNLAVDYVDAQINKKMEGASLNNCYLAFEQRAMHPKLPNSSGLADVVFVNPVLQHMSVFDYKFGQGVLVEAVDNDQQMCYAFNVLAQFEKSVSPPKTIDMHIVQPRLDNYSVFSVTPDYLYEWAEKTALTLEQLEKPNPPYNPDLEKQCRWCLGRFSCAARTEHIYMITEKAKQYAKNKTEADMDTLVFLHKQGAVLKKAIEEIGSYLLARAMQGDEIPELKLIHGKANRIPTDTDKFQKFLMGRFGQNAYKPLKFISIAEAEKKDKDLKKDAEFMKLWHKPINYKLVDVKHKSKAVEPPNKLDFGEFNEGY